LKKKKTWAPPDGAKARNKTGEHRSNTFTQQGTDDDNKNIPSWIFVFFQIK